MGGVRTIKNSLIIRHTEVALEKKLELIRIDSIRKAREQLKNIGTEINGFLYIIDPYLHNPEYIGDILETSSSIHEIKILFDFEICYDRYKINTKDIEGNYFRYSQVNNLSLILKSLSDKPGASFHDRFIFTKSRCWSVGSSFKGLGNKKTYIIDVDYISLNLAKEAEIKKSDILLNRFNNIWNSIEPNFFITRI